MNPAVREQVVVMGSRKSLVGILAPARDAMVGGDEPCVVILNAGIIHRVGPNRMHVELARALADLGYTCLRFDLAGIGDSDKRSDGLSPLDASLADVREVLDWLQATRKQKRFVLVGLCSGADQSLIYAGSDARVAGLVLLDPSVPRTAGHFVRYFGRRFLQRRQWRDIGGAAVRLLRRITNRHKAAAGDDGYEASPSLDSKEVRTYLASAYRKALDQGTSFLAVFTGDRDFLYNYRDQMLDAFKGLPFGSRLQLEFFSACDHTFCSESERTRLVGLVAQWLRSRSYQPAPAGRLAAPPPAHAPLQVHDQHQLAGCDGGLRKQA